LSGIVTLSRVTIQDGQANGDGGGILNEGILTLDQVILTCNPPSVGASINNHARLTVRSSWISENGLTGAMGTTMLGGGIYSSGTMVMGNTIVSNNVAVVGRGRA